MKIIGFSVLLCNPSLMSQQLFSGLQELSRGMLLNSISSQHSVSQHESIQFLNVLVFASIPDEIKKNRQRIVSIFFRFVFFTVQVNNFL